MSCRWVIGHNYVDTDTNLVFNTERITAITSMITLHWTIFCVQKWFFIRISHELNAFLLAWFLLYQRNSSCCFVITEYKFPAIDTCLTSFVRFEEYRSEFFDFELFSQLERKIFTYKEKWEIFRILIDDDMKTERERTIHVTIEVSLLLMRSIRRCHVFSDDMGN